MTFEKKVEYQPKLTPYTPISDGPNTEQLLKDLEEYEEPPKKTSAPKPTPTPKSQPVQQPEPIRNRQNILSREEIKQLMEDGEHLSAVSSFLGGVMSERDLDD